MARTKDRICQINIYRKDSDTPIMLYDKTSLNEEEIIEQLKVVFTSPQISLIRTSSETLILKPSQIDAIGVIDNIKKRNKLINKDRNIISDEHENEDITTEISDKLDIFESKSDSINENDDNMELDTIEIKENDEIPSNEIIDAEVEKIEIGTIDDRNGAS